jgi:hypothetical protein
VGSWTEKFEKECCNDNNLNTLWHNQSVSTQPTQAVLPSLGLHDNLAPCSSFPLIPPPIEHIRRFIFQGSDVVIGIPGRIEELLLDKGRGIVNGKSSTAACNQPHA